MHFSFLKTLNLLTIVVFFWSSLASADTTTSTVSPTTTLVWVTGTDSKGVTQTTQSAYTQQFTSFFDSVALPSPGSAGLGSVSGTIGNIRSYTFSTIGNSGGSRAGVFTRTILPTISAFLGLFML